ncbi:MAG: hypothetical protein WD688_04195 [Candidatus Binatia bacterium]
MKKRVESEPSREERNNVDIERGGANDAPDQERPRRQNRGRRGPAVKRSPRKDRGRA